MQHRGEGALPHFVAQNGGDVVVGVARVDDQRQLELARQRDLGAKDALGDVGRRVIVMIVETGLADADAFRMRGERADRRGVGLGLLGGVVGMGADGEIDRRKALGDRPQSVGLRDAGRDRRHALDAGGVGARDDARRSRRRNRGNRDGNGCRSASCLGFAFRLDIAREDRLRRRQRRPGLSRRGAERRPA